MLSYSHIVNHMSSRETASQSLNFSNCLVIPFFILGLVVFVYFKFFG